MVARLFIYDGLSPMLCDEHRSAGKHGEHVYQAQKKKAEGGLLPKEGRGTMKTACSG